jgi:O-antigen/teichoic acid export membrane protein
MGNALQAMVTFLYPVALTIVLTPVILHFIGTEQYGIFALATVFVGFLGLIDIGMGPVVQRFLAASLATSDYLEARSVLGVGYFFFSAVGLIGVVMALIGGQLVPRILSGSCRCPLTCVRRPPSSSQWPVSDSSSVPC